MKRNTLVQIKHLANEYANSFTPRANVIIFSLWLNALLSIKGTISLQFS